MAEPTCINCNRLARTCRAFESYECWVARAQWFERHYHRLRTGVLLAVREGLLELPEAEATLLTEASENDGPSDELALQGFFRAVALAVGDAPANSDERRLMLDAAREVPRG